MINKIQAVSIDREEVKRLLWKFHEEVSKYVNQPVSTSEIGTKYTYKILSLLKPAKPKLNENISKRGE